MTKNIIILFIIMMIVFAMAFIASVENNKVYFID
jgi:hypothetical protein